VAPQAGTIFGFDRALACLKRKYQWHPCNGFDLRQSRLIYVKAGCSIPASENAEPRSIAEPIKAGLFGEMRVFGNRFSRYNVEFDFDQSHCLKKRLNSP
jgi:hypothetical protein